MTSMVQNHEFADELVKLVREQKRREQRVTGDPDMDFSIYRSGSAPPTIEGSLNSIGGLFSDGSAFVGPGFMSEEEVRADPGYVNYYYSNGNLNPRLPPPLLSKEDWRLAQRNRSFFAVRQGFDGGKEAYGRRSGGDWGGDRLIGLRNGQKTIAEMIQEDLIQTTAGTRFPGGDNLGFLSAGTASFTHASVLGSSLSGKATPDPNTNNGFSASLDESSDLADALCRLNLSKNVSANENRHFSSHSQRQILDHLIPGSLQGSKLGNSNYSSEYEIAALGGPLAFGSGLMGAETQVQNLSRLRNHAPRTPYVDNLGPNGLLSPSRVAALNEAVPDRRYFGETYMDFVQKAYLEALISQQKLQYHSYYTNSGSDFWSSRSPNMSSAFQPRNLSLLDQLKSNKTMNFELSEIAGHIVEFSGDQYGSRFIQQRLETATIEEINIVFNEIMSQAHTLMTDVFGNYVVQKFLEHGTPSQIRKLGDKLMGNVLALSLHMYGCRVIQKALEVVELDQKTQMVKELDGHVMRCVRDQNGNHVIQKCIEHVSEDSIDFIVSAFYDQILTLSTHSYGCRVIQRVLEHCHNEKTQSIVIDEIMRSICMLAQDQYGNYVVQHVLEHGKPQERSAIIEKLTGQIVQMSQHKFASNVIEKCLAFGTPNQRKLLVDEMLGPTDENEHLQAMMKDQFGNYVVQKVLETCNDQQLELVFNRIKVHLNTLQKYTYGKHIVSRVEKLVAAGERRISSLSLDRS